MRISFLVGLTGLMLAAGLSMARAEEGGQPAESSGPVVQTDLPGPGTPQALPVPAVTALAVPILAPERAGGKAVRREAWCPTGHTTGTGTGFCLIN